MLRPFARSLKPCANGRSIVGCYMPRPFAHPVACCCANVVACCCAKFETGQSFQPTTPNISFVLWSPKRSATMLDPFAQLFQHCWGRAHSLRMVNKTYGLYPSHDALRVPTLLGVVAPVCTPLPTRTQQLPTLLAQQCLLAALGIRDMISYKQNWTRISRGRVALGLSSVSIGHHVLLSHFVSRLIPEKPLVVG